MKGKYKLVKQISRAHRNPAYKSQVFENKETEAAAEPHRIGVGFRKPRNRNGGRAAQDR